MNIYQKVKSINLPLDKYVVIGGSALEGCGIRKSSDIDICVTEDIYEKLKAKKDWQEVTKSDGLKVLQKDNFEIGTKWGYGKYNINVKALIDTSVVVNGIRLASLDEILNYKKVINRDKDKKDIKLIKQYLQSQI